MFGREKLLQTERVLSILYAGRDPNDLNLRAEWIQPMLEAKFIQELDIEIRAKFDLVPREQLFALQQDLNQSFRG